MSDPDRIPTVWTEEPESQTLTIIYWSSIWDSAFGLKHSSYRCSCSALTAADPRSSLIPAARTLETLQRVWDCPDAFTSHDIVIMPDQRTIRPRCEVKCVMEAALVELA